jgi:hypothetical protein
MDSLTTIAIGFEVLVFLAVIVTLIVLVVKRIDEKKNETFEKRNN